MTPVCPDKRLVWFCSPFTHSVTRLERTPVVCLNPRRISQANRIWYWKMTTSDLFFIPIFISFSKSTQNRLLDFFFFFSHWWNPLLSLFVFLSSCHTYFLLVSFLMCEIWQLHMLPRVMYRCPCQLESPSIYPIKAHPQPHRHRITKLSQTTHNVSYIIYTPDRKCSWSSLVF